MNIAQICDYLNEIGILNLENIKSYLTMISNIVNDNYNNKSINDIYIISLFAYLRGINKNDKYLYAFSTNIINSYNRYILIKKYNYLINLKKILYYKILQRLKYFMISLYKKFPFRNYNTNRNQNKKKTKNYNKTFSNNFYKENKSIQNLTKINDNKKNNFDILLNKEGEQKIINLETNININNNKNIDISPLKSDRENKDKRVYKELPCLKKSKSINLNMCINQSNINFDKFFINKKIVICKKCNPSYVEKIKNNKKELYTKNNNLLRKNKSEEKLRLKIKDYEDKTRSQNLAKIKPELKKKIKDRAKSKRDQEFYDKEKEDRLYNKLIEKEIDKKDIIDRLYRYEIIEIKKEERKQKEQGNNKLKKPPINWEKVYLQTNDKIINNSKNNRKKNKTCSYFMPNKGRVYKYEEIEKDDKNINNENINNQMINNKEDINKIKITNEINLNEEKINNKEEPNDIINNNGINNCMIKQNNENNLTNEIEEKSNKEKQEIKNINNSFQEGINSSEEEIEKRKDKFNISPGNFKSKEIQSLLQKANGNPAINFQKNGEMKDPIFSSYESEDEIKNGNIIKEENDNNGKTSNEGKMKFEDLLCSNNTENNE